MLYEFWHNFTHNLFKPLLLFFYLGFLIPILKVKFEFPYVLYQGLTLYLLLAIGWHGGEQLANIDPANIVGVVGFMVLGFFVNCAIGFLAYALLTRMTSMRRVDRATVAGYYGSDSAGTFATCVGVLGAVGMAFDAYMPVMLAVMEIPGAMVALFLVARLRRRGMDPAGNMPDEPGDDAAVDRRVLAASQAARTSDHGGQLESPRQRALDEELEMALEKREHPEPVGAGQTAVASSGLFTGQLVREIVLNPGLYLLFGGITVGFVAGLQGPDVTRSGDIVFVNAFQGVLCLFLLEMGMTAARKLKDLKDAGRGLVAFGVLAPNIFAALGITVMHGYAQVTHTHFELGNYVLFAVLCGSASYIAVPAVQRLAIPEASPTLPLAASLGLTFSYNVTIGIPVYIQLAHAITGWLPIG
jgi:hypothetical protein